MIGQVQQFGSEIPSNRYSFTVKRSVRMSSNSQPRRTSSVACLVNAGIGFIITGSMLIGFGSMATGSLGGFILYTIGVAFLILALFMCAIGIMVFCKRARNGGPENSANDGHEMNPTAATNNEGQGQTQGNGTANPGDRYIANQARQDLPPSYRSSRLFVTISGVPDTIDEEEQEAPHSPPPSYSDVCTDSNAPPV